MCRLLVLPSPPPLAPQLVRLQRNHTSHRTMNWPCLRRSHPSFGTSKGPTEAGWVHKMSAVCTPIHSIFKMLAPSSCLLPETARHPFFKLLWRHVTEPSWLHVRI